MSEQDTSSNRRCPDCGKGLLVARQIDETFEFDLGEEKIEVHAKNVPIEQCDHCGIQLSGPEAAKVHHEAVCRAAGFLTPQEIKALRDGLSLSQEKFARLLGLGIATISRMERGRLLPNRSSDNLLYLLAKSKDAQRLLEHRFKARRPTDGEGGGTTVRFSESTEEKRELQKRFHLSAALAA